MFECCTVMDICRDAAVVKREDQLVIHQHIGTTCLVFQRFDVGDQFLVVREERRTRLELPPTSAWRMNTSRDSATFIGP